MGGTSLAIGTIVVADAGPLIHLDELDKRALDLVGDVAFEEIVIAREVLFEVLANLE